MRAAMQAAIGSLTAGRTTKERVVVRGSGSIAASTRVSLPSHTALDVCGTIDVTGSGSGDMAPVYSRGTTQVEVRHLTVTGRPVYGIFMRNVNNLSLGQITMRLSGGLGVRIDNRGDTSGGGEIRLAERTEFPGNRNITLQNLTVTNSRITENPCTDNLAIRNITLNNSRIVRC
jgi:hypothetical protein